MKIMSFSVEVGVVVLVSLYRGYKFFRWIDYLEFFIWEIILVLFFKVGFFFILFVVNIKMFYELFWICRWVKCFCEYVYVMIMCLGYIVFMIWCKERSVLG